jgi:hypothetical protein
LPYSLEASAHDGAILVNLRQPQSITARGFVGLIEQGKPMRVLPPPADGAAWQATFAADDIDLLAFHCREGCSAMPDTRGYTAEIVRLGRDGAIKERLAEIPPATLPGRLTRSPDGLMIAFSTGILLSGYPDPQLWVVEVGGQPRLIGSGADPDWQPAPADI